MPYSYFPAGGPIIPLTILGLIIFAFTCTLAVGKYEERVYGPVSTSKERRSSHAYSKTPGRTQSDTVDSTSQLSLAKTSSGQLFW